MAQTVFGAAYVVAAVNRAFSNTSLGNAVFNNNVTVAGTTQATQYAYAASVGQNYAGVTDAALAATVLANLGVTATADLTTALTGAFASAGVANRGIVVLQLATLLSSLETATGTLAVYNTAAVNWNKTVEQSFVYSSNTANTSASTGTISATAGQTYTLTTGVDNVPGTAGDDTIIADNTDTTKLQLTVADTINGGAGNDTLKVYQAAATTTFPAVSVTGVEKLYLNGGALTALDATLLAGLTAVEIDSAVQTTTGGTYTITTSGQAITLSNQKSGYTGAANAAQTFVTKLTSTADTAATVTLNKVANATHTGADTNTYTDIQTLDIAGTKVTSLSLASTGAANTLTLTNSAASAPLATLTITGDKNLTLTAALANVKTINASAATGNVAVDTSGATANAALAFTGGAGNDKLTLAAGALVSTQALDGGAGTDTLVIKDTSISGSTTTLNTAINKITNFEVLGFAGTSLSADLSKVTSVTQFSVEAAITGAAGAASTAAVASTAGTVGALFSGESNTQSIILNAAVTGGVGGAGNALGGGVAGSAGAAAVQVTPSLDNGSNAVALTFSGVTLTGGQGGNGSTAGDAAGNGGAALDLTSFESVTLTSNANAAGTVTTNTLTGGAAAATGTGSTAGSGLLVGANATITVSGAAALNLGSIVSNPGQANNNNLTLNASNLTGNLTATTGAGNDVITGGSGVNNITLSGGVDTVDLSKSVAKADTIAFASATGTSKSGIAITGFTNALNTGDKLDLIGNLAAANITTSGTATVNAAAANAVTATINNKGIVSFSAVGASAALSDYVDAVFSAINGAGNKVAAFTFGSDTYVVEDNGTAGAYNAGTDLVVKLVGITGVTALSATASDATTVFVA